MLEVKSIFLYILTSKNAYDCRWVIFHEPSLLHQDGDLRSWNGYLGRREPGDLVQGMQYIDSAKLTEMWKYHEKLDPLFY